MRAGWNRLGDGSWGRRDTDPADLRPAGLATHRQHRRGRGGHFPRTAITSTSTCQRDALLIARLDQWDFHSNGISLSAPTGVAL